MSMRRENHHILPNTFYTAPLESWACAVQRRSFVAEQCFLEKVEHCKALSDMEHEFLVVYASHPSGSKIVLGIDRNAQDSSRALNSVVYPRSLPPTSSEKDSPHLAYDRVQVSHDGTPAPILTQSGSCVVLYTITFSPNSPPLTASDTSTTSSNSKAKCPPSILHLSVLLFTINACFPCYTLLKYQCYFFARATCLALIDLFGGVETELKKGKRAATWRGVHVSLYSAGCTELKELLPLVATPVLQRILLLETSPELHLMLLLLVFVALRKMLLLFGPPGMQHMFLPLLLNPSSWILVPAGILAAVYRTAKFYDGNVVGSEVDRWRISDERIRQYAIPSLYRCATWRIHSRDGRPRS
ncbi:hypothetical protein BGY98DRAFT_1071935 [Russula aff. rugulosa BPL654]|nr:hypothetical protein BGY98DRAFT_1071935 [Russula aff. rugulosa BPL654]